MIAKITRGKNPGDIGVYLHGPGKRMSTPIRLLGNGLWRCDGRVKHWHGGQTDARLRAREMHKALNTSLDIKNPVWHASLRNTKADRTLSNEQILASHSLKTWGMWSIRRYWCATEMTTHISWSLGSMIWKRCDMPGTSEGQRKQRAAKWKMAMV